VPKFTNAISFEVVEGSGTFRPLAKTTNMVGSWKYWFRPADFERGYVKFLIEVEPFPNCYDGELERVITIILTE
jgi:hypothetical protein